MKGKLSIGEDIKTLLKEIYSLVEDACCEAIVKKISDPSFLADNAVNWGDLGCADVQLFTDDGECFNLVATVEEADSSAQELQAFIKDYLYERGYDIIVMTEW